MKIINLNIYLKNTLQIQIAFNLLAHNKNNSHRTPIYTI